MGPLRVILREVSVQVLCPFLNWIVCLRGLESCEFLYILEIKTFCQNYHWQNIFSVMFGSLYILLMFLFAVYQLFNLFKSHLFVLSFISLVLRDISVKTLLHGISEISLPIFFSKIFMVSWHIWVFYPPSIYFCVWYKLVVKFQVFACSYPDLPASFVEEAVFTPFYASASFVEY